MDTNRQDEEGLTCAVVCWIVAALCGALIVVILMVLFDVSPILSIFLAALAFVIVGILLPRYFCSDFAEAQSYLNDFPDEIQDSDESDAEVVVSETDEETPAADRSEPVKAVSSATEDIPKDTEVASAVSTDTLLSGEEELASRKGEYRYYASGADQVASEPTSEPTPPVIDEDFDGDGVLEGTEEGSKPETLSAARDGKADNLKEIKGVGPKLEQVLNSLGFFHFDQIARWSADEVAWVNANLSGFKGRATRDKWVEQANTLAKGGETEFSQRVEDGDVY